MEGMFPIRLPLKYDFLLQPSKSPKSMSLPTNDPLSFAAVFHKKSFNMNKTILTYGLISGAVASVLMFSTALYYRSASEFKYGEIFGYVGILLSMLFVYFGVRAYRDGQAGGALSFGKALQAGLLITLISCVCYVITWMVVYEYVMPDFMDKFIEQTLAHMKQSGMDEARFQQEAAKMQEYKTMYQNPLTRMALTFMEPLPIGLLTALVSSLILKRK